MRDQLRSRLSALVARLRRLERRELYELRRWLEDTGNLVHLSILLFVPLLIGFVTWLSNSVGVLPFLLFPPLASGTYTLFANPESRYASPTRFVGGLTVGSLCGLFALALGAVVGLSGPDARFAVSPIAAAVSVFLTGAVTWLLDIEEASAYSSALLIHVIDTASANSIPLLVTANTRIMLTPELAYVVSVLISSIIVASVFVGWREQFYEQRAKYLYQSIRGDDHVLVPMRTETATSTAMFGAQLAAAHDAGKVVLLDLVDDEQTASAERALLDQSGSHHNRSAGTDDGGHAAVDSNQPTGTEHKDGDRTAIDAMAARRAVAEAATQLEEQAQAIETQVGVPCEVVVATAGKKPGTSVLQTARQANCDLIATPYEEHHGSLSPFVRRLFRGDLDVLVHRSVSERTEWRRVMVPVRRAGDVAHAMIDFAIRLTGRTGQVTVSNCTEPGRGQRQAQEMLSNLVEPFDGPLETLVSRSDIEPFLNQHANEYDVVLMGASMDRSAASRLVSPPTFERMQDIDCDVAIVDRNFR